MKNLAGMLITVAILALVVACSGSKGGEAPAYGPAGDTGGPVSVRSPAYWPTKGWRTSTPEEQGMDSELLAEAMGHLLKTKEHTRIHSMLIVRHGYIVADAYFYPFGRDSKHDVACVSKSFMSTMIGIAIDKGYIDGVRQPVLGFFPGRTVANVDADKRAMTLEDLLTNRSGFACINGATEATLMEMLSSPDWVQFALDLPMAERPGTRFVYCSSNQHLLSAIIQQAAGVSALEFAQAHLFGPLGISDVAWPADPRGYNHGWAGMRMTPHDMAKLGLLYLQKGRWEGRQVVSPAWVETATRAPEGADPADWPDHLIGDGYGYLWWISSDWYRAVGRGATMIHVVPDEDMVVVLTGAGGKVGEEWLRTYIIPAARSETPLPPNRDGLALLESRIREAATPPQAEPKPVPPLPGIAQRVSGRTYVLEPNLFGLKALSMTFHKGGDEAVFRWTPSIDADGGGEVEYRVGLDNVFRFSPGRFGLPAAARGSWESDNVFILHLDEIGNICSWRFILTFEGNRVTVQMQEVGTDLGEATFGGTVAD